MPLSEHEQRLLDQMEQALAKDDPRFAMYMRGARGARIRPAVLLGAVGFVVGLALVVLGVMSQWWIGVLGFVVMVASGTYAFAPRPPAGAAPNAAVGAGPGAARPSGATVSPFRAARGGKGSRAVRPTAQRGTFMARLEQRWDARRHPSGW